MNLFCFSLEGSTDNLYEPAYEPAYQKNSIKDRVPNWQTSPPLLRNGERWRGSDPCFYPEQSHTTQVKIKKRRSHVPTSTSDNIKSDNTDTGHLFWQPFRETQDLVLNRNNHNKETWTGPRQSCVLSADDRVEQLNLEREKYPLTQGVNFEAWNPNYERSDNNQLELTGEVETEADVKRTLSRIQRLVRVKKGSQSGAEEGKSSSDGHLADSVFKEASPVRACIGLSKRLVRAEPSPPHKQAKESKGRPWSSGVHDHHWSPTEVPPPWDPTFHNCHCPSAQPWARGIDFTLPPATDWECLESLVLERDGKRPGFTRPRIVRSITDLDISESTTADGQSVESGEATPGTLGRRMKAVSQTMCKRTGDLSDVSALSADVSEETERGEGGTGEAGGGWSLARGCRRSSDSLESLYSLNSGRSSSSGVTSASDGSVNRLRPEEDLPFGGPFCGRARVHTDFVPSPYDTESLTLKVGDVIDIISKPPMGIWSGLLKDKVGNFKFIYADLLTEREPVLPRKMRSHSRSQRPRPKTLQGLMEHLSLEEYASSLLLNGYQTMEDLKELREQHLEELRVTDPEHRRRLLAAVERLQEPQYERQKGGGDKQDSRSPEANLNSYPRDSGCYIPSDCSNSGKEDTEGQVSSDHLPLDTEDTEGQVSSDHLPLDTEDTEDHVSSDHLPLDTEDTEGQVSSDHLPLDTEDTEGHMSSDLLPLAAVYLKSASEHS